MALFLKDSINNDPRQAMASATTGSFSTTLGVGSNRGLRRVQKVYTMVRDESLMMMVS